MGVVRSKSECAEVGAAEIERKKRMPERVGGGGTGPFENDADVVSVQTGSGVGRNDLIPN